MNKMKIKNKFPITIMVTSHEKESIKEESDYNSLPIATYCRIVVLKNIREKKQEAVPQ
jgi:hypothetical protein